MSCETTPLVVLSPLAKCGERGDKARVFSLIMCKLKVFLALIETGVGVPSFLAYSAFDFAASCY